MKPGSLLNPDFQNVIKATVIKINRPLFVCFGDHAFVTETDNRRTIKTRFR
jgi:hypothetical protein